MKKILNFNDFIFESEETIYPGLGANDPYVYKRVNGVWFTKKKNGSKWISLAGDKISSDKLNKAYPQTKETVKPVEPVKNPTIANPYQSGRQVQRDTFEPYRQKAAQEGQSRMFYLKKKSDEMKNGIIPMKPSSGIKPHYRIFGDYLKLRKNPVTSADFTKGELETMREMIEKSGQKLGPTRKQVNFTGIAGVNFTNVVKGTEEQVKIDDQKSIAYTLGNAGVSDKGNYYKIEDIYDFNCYNNNPQAYSLKNAPATIKTAFQKIFNGNLVQGVEELASYYQALGYTGIPVSIEIPKAALQAKSPYGPLDYRSFVTKA